MKVFISGPYTLGDVAQNVRAAVDVADVLLSRGHAPYVPHLSHFWHVLHPHEWDAWIGLDREWLACCSAVIRIPGESKGADLEVQEAQRLNIPVFESIEEFMHAGY